MNNNVKVSVTSEINFISLSGYLIKSFITYGDESSIEIRKMLYFTQTKHRLAKFHLMNYSK